METVLFEPNKTVPLSKFLPELRFEFKDLPDELFYFALLRSARAMAQEGHLIRRRAVINTQHCVTRYALHSPDELEINAILGIRVSSCCYDGAVKRSFDPPDDSCCVHADTTWFDDIEQVLHIEKPLHHATYYVTLSVMPTLDACALPAVFYNEYIETLMLGAKSRILRIDNKPWTNLQLAALYDKNFVDNIPLHAMEVATHKQRGFVKMKFGKVL